MLCPILASCTSAHPTVGQTPTQTLPHSLPVCELAVQKDVIIRGKGARGAWLRGAVQVERELAPAGRDGGGRRGWGQQEGWRWQRGLTGDRQEGGQRAATRRGPPHHSTHMPHLTHVQVDVSQARKQGQLVVAQKEEERVQAGRGLWQCGVVVVWGG